MKADIAEGEVPLKQLNVLIPVALHRALKCKCAEDGLPMTTIIEILVGRYVAGRIALVSEPKQEKD